MSAKSKTVSNIPSKPSKTAIRNFTAKQKELYKDFDFFDKCEPKIDFQDKMSAPVKTATAEENGEKSQALKYYPKDPVPINIILPFPNKTKYDNYVNKYLETASLQVGNQIRKLTTGRGSTKPPGWLIEIPEKYFAHVLGIIDILESVENPIRPYDEIEALRKILTREMKLGVEEDEICEVLKRIPLTVDNKFSFSHFMYAIANPIIAEHKRIFLVESRKCKCATEEFEDLFNDIMADLDMDDFDFKDDKKDDAKKTATPKAKALPKYGAMGNDYLHLMEMKKKKPGMNPKTGKIQKKVYASGYSPREQILYSALFYIKVYPTMKRFEKIFNRDYIPVSQFELKRRAMVLGFEGDGIGIKYKGFAEWDRIPNKPPTFSPYLSSRTLVNNRVKLFVPNHEESGQFRDRSVRKNMHLIIKPPSADDMNGTIKLMENRYRIRKTMKYLATEGDVIAKLPSIDSLIAFGNTIVSALEEIIMNPTTAPKPPAVNHSLDFNWITSEALHLYKTYTIPRSLKRLDPTVPVNVGRKIRTKAEIAHQLNWTKTCDKRTQFRRDLWKRLNPEQIPCGRLRDSFIDAFQTLVPRECELATVMNKNPYVI